MKGGYLRHHTILSVVCPVVLGSAYDCLELVVASGCWLEIGRTALAGEGAGFAGESWGTDTEVHWPPRTSSVSCNRRISGSGLRVESDRVHWSSRARGKHSKNACNSPPNSGSMPQTSLRVVTCCIPTPNHEKTVPLTNLCVDI